MQSSSSKALVVLNSGPISAQLAQQNAAMRNRTHFKTQSVSPVSWLPPSLPKSLQTDPVKVESVGPDHPEPVEGVEPEEDDHQSHQEASGVAVVDSLVL